MAFLTNRPTLLRHFISQRTCTFNTLLSRNKSFRQALPKFTYPNNDTVPRQQLARSRPAPVYKDGLASGNKPNKVGEEPAPMEPKKYMEFLSDDLANDLEDAEAIGWIMRKDMVARNNKKAAEMNKKRKEATSILHELTVATPPAPERMSDKKYAVNNIANKKNDEPEWVHLMQHRQRKRLRNKSYFEKVFKIQHENMQRVQKNVKQIKLRLENLKIQQRIEKLMQLQHMLEELDPVSCPSHRQNNRSIDHSRRNRDGLQPVIPVQLKNVHPAFAARSKHSFSDPEPYTPAHADSDNGDVAARASKSVVKIRFDQAANLAQKSPSKETSKESAIYKLCKSSPVIRFGNTKY